MMSERRGYGFVEPGAVALVSGVTGDLLLPAIVVASGEDTLTVVPLHPEVEHATEWDLVLDTDVLGYAAIAQVWNYGSVLVEQCRDVVARLGANPWRQVQRLLSAAVGGQPAPGDLPVGPPTLSPDDPRLLFQDAEAEAAHEFWQPALALAGAATLGELVRHRREEVQVDPAELPEGGANWLKPLELDAIDLRSAVPPAGLAALLRRLGLRASTRLRTIVRSTIEASSPQLARGSADVDDQRVSTDAYLDAVFSELEGDVE